MRTLSLTKDWNRSLKRYVSLFSFSIKYLMSNNNNKVLSFIYSVDEAQLVVCGDDIGFNGTLYRQPRDNISYRGGDARGCSENGITS